MITTNTKPLGIPRGLAFFEGPSIVFIVRAKNKWYNTTKEWRKLHKII